MVGFGSISVDFCLRARSRAPFKEAKKKSGGKEAKKKAGGKEAKKKAKKQEAKKQKSRVSPIRFEDGFYYVLI